MVMPQNTDCAASAIVRSCGESRCARSCSGCCVRVHAVGAACAVMRLMQRVLSCKAAPISLSCCGRGVNDHTGRRGVFAELHACEDGVLFFFQITSSHSI